MTGYIFKHIRLVLPSLQATLLCKFAAVHYGNSSWNDIFDIAAVVHDSNRP